MDIICWKYTATLRAWVPMGTDRAAGRGNRPPHEGNMRHHRGSRPGRRGGGKEMADLEKVIKGLELCLVSIDSEGCTKECP